MKQVIGKCLIGKCLRVAITGAVFGAGSTLFAADKNDAKPLMDEATIFKGIKGPKDFNVTVFASPPNVMYPTAVASTPNGEVYVAIDEDGSLGKDPGKGRVVKCIDTDGDGKADKFITFAKMEHPRGIYFDTASDTLYVLHPPFITAFKDTNGDGVSDTSEVIATGICTEKTQKDRGADHTTNGFRVGIDGWMYIAQGDFGSTKAVGKDGTGYTRHGGGVSRIRLDGTGLEMFSTGQRNICDVAVDPLCNVYTRDNTNDGDGWDVRLSYVVPSGYYGYPSMYKTFKDEAIAPLADYGGGSPVGALYLAEPNYPGDLGNSLYTVEWGRGAIFRHPLEPNGANFKAKAEEFMTVPRGIDMDADAIGHLYVASWVNGGFAYSGPNVGYVVRLTPKEHKPATFPELKKLDDAQLVEQLATPSAVGRQFAQREILFRGEKFAQVAAVEALASSNQSLPVRVAAMFTLKQLQGSKSTETIIKLCKQDDLRELALRALADKAADTTIPAGPFVEALNDSNPRVRLIAAWGLARLNKTDAAAQIIPLVADADPLVSHIAITSLVTLKAAAPAMKAVDPATPKLIPGALRVLQGLHETQVVDGLTDKLKTIEDPTTRSMVYRALCRLTFREADWTGDWWGTRPDTSGPYFKNADWDGTEKVKGILKSALDSEKPAVIKTLVVDLQQHKIDFPELTPTLAKLAAADPTFKDVIIDLFGNKRDLTDEQVGMLKAFAISEEDKPALRAKALRALQKSNSKTNALNAASAALLAIKPTSAKELTSAYKDYVSDNKLVQSVPYFTKMSESDDAAKRELGFVVLVNVANNKLLAKDKQAIAAGKTIDAAWGNPTRAASLLNAIGRARADAYKSVVLSLQKDSHAEIASAAVAAGEALGLNKTTATTSDKAPIESIAYDKVVAAALKEKGDPKLGAELFTKQGCVQCHTTLTSEAPKGPFLGGIATRYSRAELCESILKPSAKISQGFETQWFKTTEGDDIEGFVTREAGNEVELRNVAGIVTTLNKNDIKERGKRETSIMPNGLVDKLTPADLASILAYLESTRAK